MIQKWKLETVFKKLVVYAKDCCSQNVSCPICNIVINRSSLNKHKKRAHNSKSLISNKHLIKMFTNYKDYMRLHEITWIVMDYRDYIDY